MKQLKIFDRKSKSFFIEKIYGQKTLVWLYKKSFFSWLVRFLVSCFPFVSQLYGLWNKSSFSKKKIKPFIREFEIDSSVFLKAESEFSSFNDFFTRKLKPSSRPLAAKEAVIPADGRYLVFPSLKHTNQDKGIQSFFVKDKSFNLKSFLKDPVLAEKYASGSMLIARLAPVDCHRFYFPFDCVPQKSKLINGCLYSVNPLALKKSLKNFLENKRVLTRLKTTNFKEVLCLEVGATNVGSIVQTYEPEKAYKKGDEKGYFELGGSTIVFLFEENTIQFDQDLIDNSQKGIETYACIGDLLGSSC